MTDSFGIEMSILSLIRIAVGMTILTYVGYCLLNQKVWIRGGIGLKSKIFAWGTRKEHPTIFLLHIIVGIGFGIYMIAISGI